MAQLSLGLDVGGTNIKAALLDGNHAVVRRARFKTASLGDDPDLILSGLEARIRGFVNGAGLRVRDLRALGLACAGLVNSEAGRLEDVPNITPWEGLEIGPWLADRFDCTVHLENDVNAIVYGEWLLGAGRGTRNLVCLALGTGVGGGLILDGRLYTGHLGLGAELGHTTIERDGRLCACGNRGCVEAYAGAVGRAGTGQETPRPRGPGGSAGRRGAQPEAARPRGEGGRSPGAGTFGGRRACSGGGDRELDQYLRARAGADRGRGLSRGGAHFRAGPRRGSGQGHERGRPAHRAAPAGAGGRRRGDRRGAPRRGAALVNRRGWGALLVLAALCGLSTGLPAQPAAPVQPPPGAEVYIITGDNFQRSQRGQIVLSTLDQVHLTSDSMQITARHAERREDARLGLDGLLLQGDVVAIEGKTRITGDNGHYDRWRKVARVDGNVRIWDGETEIFCREAEYERISQRIHLKGDVKVIQEGSLTYGNRIVYLRDSGHVEAFESVELHDLESRSILRGEHGSYDRELDVAQMDSLPRLTVVEAEEDTVRVAADFMRQIRSDSLAIATGNVRYLRGDSEALCDSAVYYQGRDVLELYGRPRLLQEKSVLSGESMTLFFNGSELIAMDVDGKASYVDEPADQRVFPGQASKIEGDNFHVRFRDGLISTVEVQGKPRSFYIPSVEEVGRAAVNEVTGDSMYLAFSEGILDEVRIFGSAEGRYRYLDNWRSKTAGAMLDGMLSAESGAPESSNAAASDSLPLFAADSLFSRPSALPDSVFALDPGSDEFNELSTTIKYRARDIVYKSRINRVYLEGEAEVENDEFILAAKTIRFDARDDFLDARGEPLLIEKDERLYGRLMEYSMDSKHGLIHEGSTRFGEGYYSGARLKKKDDGNIYVANSEYTTCEYDPPHFHFETDRMTMRTGDKVVGAPVRFYLGNIPLFYLPFIFSNLERGRRSGFLQPDFEFGISLDGNKPRRFVRDIGYFFALSDYADLTTEMDFVEDQSLFGSLRYRYYRRYFLGGSVHSNLTYDRSKSLASRQNSWGLRGTHSQDFSEDTRLSANVDFVSSESLRDIDNYTVEETINQRLSSNLSFSQKWDNVSLTTSYSRTQILGQEDADAATDNLLVDERIPVSIATTSIPLWPGGAQTGIRGALAKLKLKPSLRYSRNKKSYETRSTVSESASTGSSLGFNYNLAFINLRPSVSVSENWSRSNIPVSSVISAPLGLGDGPADAVPLGLPGVTDDLGTTVVETVEPGEFSHRWSASTSASTRFYGIFYPRIGRLSGIRHTVAPSATWTYSESRGERFSLSRRLGLSLDNTIDLKFGDEDDVVRKTGVLNWGLRTGLDLTKKGEEREWDNLSSSLRLSPIPGLTFSMSQSFDPNRGQKLNSTLSSSLSLSGKFGYGKVEKGERQSNVVASREGNLIDSERAQAVEDSLLAIDGDGFRAQEDQFDPLMPFSERGGSRGAGAPGRQNWNLGLSFSLNQTPTSRPSPSVALGGSITLTENWSIDYRTNLRLEDGELGSQTLNVTRDLHCWEATFSRLVFQGREQYYFRIFLKAHSEDIKIESGDRSAGFSRF